MSTIWSRSLVLVRTSSSAIASNRARPPAPRATARFAVRPWPPSGAPSRPPPAHRTRLAGRRRRSTRGRARRRAASPARSRRRARRSNQWNASPTNAASTDAVAERDRLRGPGEHADAGHARLQHAPHAGHRLDRDDSASGTSTSVSLPVPAARSSTVLAPKRSTSEASAAAGQPGGRARTPRPSRRTRGPPAVDAHRPRALRIRSSRSRRSASASSGW